MAQSLGFIGSVYAQPYKINGIRKSKPSHNHEIQDTSSLKNRNNVPQKDEVFSTTTK